MYPSKPKPATVENNVELLTYPRVPNPSVVDVRFVDVTSPDPPPPPPPDALIVTIPSPCVGSIVIFVPAMILVTAVDKYPRVPNPLTVDIKEDVSRGVLTRLLADDKYPKVANPRVVLTKSTSLTFPPD